MDAIIFRTRHDKTKTGRSKTRQDKTNIKTKTKAKCLRSFIYLKLLHLCWSKTFARHIQITNTKTGDEDEDQDEHKSKDENENEHKARRKRRQACQHQFRKATSKNGQRPKMRTDTKCPFLDVAFLNWCWQACLRFRRALCSFLVFVHFCPLSLVFCVQIDKQRPRTEDNRVMVRASDSLGWVGG